MQGQSFSSMTREELCRIPRGKECCMTSELCAVTTVCGGLSFRGRGRVQVTYQVENVVLAKRIFLLLKNLLNITARLHYVQHARFGGRRECVLTLGDNDSQTLLLALGMMEKDDNGAVSLVRTTPRASLTRNCCRRSFVRGAFLGCGSVSDPEKEYHAEFAVDDEHFASMLQRILEKYDIPHGTYERGKKHIIYVKTADSLSTLLALMGAANAMLALENIRITKDARLKANRAQNCDDANSNKSINAAMEQLDAISLIAVHRGLSSLPPALADIARLRMENPHMSMAELGENLTPPVGKSGVNHRMRRIIEIAREIQSEHDSSEGAADK